MRRVIAIMMFLVICQAVALAQSSGERRGWGYVFGGAGASSGDGSVAMFQVGGGGEGLIYKGLGLGAEVGYIAPFERAGNGFGIFSPNLSYHFSNNSSKVVPFVTGGYSLAFRNATASGGNFGGGVQYWVKEHVGLRFEFRDHIFSSDTPHFFQFHLGLSFR